MSEEIDKAAALKDVPLFALLDDSERSVLAERVDIVSHAAKTTLFGVGDPGDSMFIVLSGQVEISFKNDTGEKIILENAREGDFFGEISLLDGGARTASAFVVEDLKAIVIDRGDLDEYFRIKPHAALDFLAATGRRLRENSKLLRHTASRNANEAVEDNRTLIIKVADWIAAFSGSMNFLFLHAGLFFIWIIFNVEPLASTGIGGWDKNPFGLLTMSVSLEAIFLSVFVLISANRQAERDKRRNDIEFNVNVKAELQIAHMHEKIDNMHAEIMKRLERIEKDKKA